jgi:hypothetical protein
LRYVKYNMPLNFIAKHDPQYIFCK